jgi:rSAM/selenodomain-associated transferase 1
MQLNQAKVIVFARAPVKGQVKTRLARAVGDDRALAVYFELLGSVLQEMSGCGLPVYCYSDNPKDSYFDLWKETGIAFQQQTGDDLGERMFNSLKTEQTDLAPVILLGSDCPQLTCEVIRKVIDDLSKGKQVVIVPATDGGYVLIAFAGIIHASLFEGINWSSEIVLQQTKEKLKLLGLSFSLLEPLLDIDTLDDYENWLRISQ